MSDIFDDIEVLDGGSSKNNSVNRYGDDFISNGRPQYNDSIFSNNDSRSAYTGSVFNYDDFDFISNMGNGNKTNNIMKENRENIKSVYKHDDIMKENRKNSVGSKKPISVSTQKKKVKATEKIADAKRRAIACILGLSIAFGLGITSNVAINKANDKLEACEYLDRYDSIINTNVHYNINNTFWYDTLEMAKDVLSTEDAEMALFALYNGLTYKPVTCTSEVFSDAMSISKGNFLGGAFETFPEYVKSLGCIDKDGNADYDAYKEHMMEVALIKSMAEESGVNLDKSDQVSNMK